MQAPDCEFVHYLHQFLHDEPISPILSCERMRLRHMSYFRQLITKYSHISGCALTTNHVPLDTRCWEPWVQKQQHHRTRNRVCTCSSIRCKMIPTLPLGGKACWLSAEFQYFTRWSWEVTKTEIIERVMWLRRYPRRTSNRIGSTTSWRMISKLGLPMWWAMLLCTARPSWILWTDLQGHREIRSTRATLRISLSRMLERSSKTFPTFIFINRNRPRALVMDWDETQQLRYWGIAVWHPTLRIQKDILITKRSDTSVIMFQLPAQASLWTNTHIV